MSATWKLAKFQIPDTHSMVPSDFIHLVYVEELHNHMAVPELTCQQLFNIAKCSSNATKRNTLTQPSSRVNMCQTD